MILHLLCGMAVTIGIFLVFLLVVYMAGRMFTLGALNSIKHSPMKED